jgi:hypothetical protein
VGEQDDHFGFVRVPGFSFPCHFSLKIGFLELVGTHAQEFQLTPALDCGDHTDFTGLISKEIFRFDVTTNAEYKKLKDYEPLQKDSNAKYKIAFVDLSGNIKELIDINFPFCPDCGQGRMIDIVVLLTENYNDKGEYTWTNDQVLIGVCNNCQYFEEQNRISTHFLSDFNTKISNAFEYERDKLEYRLSNGQNPLFDTTKIVQSHVKMILPYLRKQFDKSILALCDISYNGCFGGECQPNDYPMRIYGIFFQKNVHTKKI